MSAAHRWTPDAGDTINERLARYQRMAISPKGFRDMLLATEDIDVRSLLSSLTTVSGDGAVHRPGGIDPAGVEARR